MNKLIKNGLLVSSFLATSSLTCFAGTNLDFALKLAKEGYPLLAQQYLEKEPAKSDPNKEGRNKVLGEIELQLARSTSDLKTKKEHLANAAKYFKLTKQTAIEAAEFSFSLANQIKMSLREPGLSEAAKMAIANEVIPYFEESKNQYKSYLEANKKSFEEFMDKVTSDERGTFIKSKEGQAGIKNIYSPYVIAQMRYFECVVEKANLQSKSDPSRSTGLDKVISEADDFGYLVEAPVPTATIGVYVARIYGIMADSGVNAKENQEKAIEKFKEILNFEKPSHPDDANIVRNIKAQAINGMIEMALRTTDYAAAIEALDIYTNGKIEPARKDDPNSGSKIEQIMPSNYKFNEDDFEVMLNGMIINANAYKKAKDQPKEMEKFQRNIDKLRLHLEKAVPLSNSSGYWKKKLNSYITEAAIITDKPINDPLIFIQLADEKKYDNKFEEAIALYEKALAGKIGGTDKITKKPGAYNNLSICAARLEKWPLAVKALKDFFAEFPPSDPKNKGLVDQYKMAAKNYFNFASRVYAETKADADKDVVMKALDILELFHPEGVVFTKIDALIGSGNFIDAIKLADTIKKDSVDYDKGLYYKGLSQFNYSRTVKSKNDETHNELSLKLAMDAKKTFEELVAFIKSDPTDIIQDKKEKRQIWEKEAKKLIAFLLVSLEDYPNAITALSALNEEYKKNPEEKKHSNRMYVLQSLISSYSKLYSTEKDSNVKQAMIPKVEAIYNEFKDLDVSAFESRDKTRKAEERKSDILSNYSRSLGMMMIMNPLKDAKLISKGVDILNESSKGTSIENMDLYLAGKFQELKEFENATIYFLKVKKLYEDKGWSSPLVPDDFAAVKSKLITDENRTFFKVNFENHAFPPKDTEGNEIKKNTRDYGRLRKNLEYILTDGTTSKTEEPEEKAFREKLQATVKKEPWVGIKASGELLKLQKKLKEFQTYLGVIDDLAICSQKTFQYEDAIKYLELLRLNNPGIMMDDKKIADIKFDYAKYLMKDKANNDKALALFNETLKLYLELKTRLGSQPNSKLYFEINEKRLINSAMIYKISQKQEVIDQIHSALNILSSNHEAYVEYVNLFAVLEEMNQLPPNLKPKTPEEIREINKANEEKDKAEELKLIEAKKQQEIKDLEKRNQGAVGADCSFFPIEMRDLDSAQFDLYKSYYEKIQGAPPLKSDATESDLLDAFNLLLRNPLLHKSFPPEFNRNDPVTAGYIKSLDEYVQLQGKKAEGTTQTISLNRKLIELCFPQLPKIIPKQSSSE